MWTDDRAIIPARRRRVEQSPETQTHLPQIGECAVEFGRFAADELVDV
jgi:hypothetical protein